MLAQTFATDNASVAALLIAMFPALPASPLDQRFHLQVLPGFQGCEYFPLRHLLGVLRPALVSRSTRPANLYRGHEQGAPEHVQLNAELCPLPRA